MLPRLMPAYASLAFAFSIAFAEPVGAQTNDSADATHMSSVAISCPQADHAVMAGFSHMQSTMPAPSGNLDKDFAAMMNVHENAMMDMAKLEVRCGKDPKVKEAAQRFVQNAPRTHRFSGDSEKP